MNTRTALRTISTILICTGVLIYIAAKIHFFRHYGEASYFQHHRVYWILIAAIGFAPGAPFFAQRKVGPLTVTSTLLLTSSRAPTDLLLLLLFASRLRLHSDIRTPVP